jgi:hypothetical protein
MIKNSQYSINISVVLRPLLHLYMDLFLCGLPSEILYKFLKFPLNVGSLTQKKGHRRVGVGKRLIM